MKLIVAGGRDFTDTKVMNNVLDTLVRNKTISNDSELVCGMARGADITAYNLFISFDNRIHEFPVDWNGPLGKRAGFVRNEQMGDFADKLVAFWDGQSRGTKHMIIYMRGLKKPVHVFDYRGNPR